MTANEWPLYEVFIRSGQGLAHRHVGSLHAADATMALENARDVYTRRNEGRSIWVVPSTEITAAAPHEKGEIPAHVVQYRRIVAEDAPSDSVEVEPELFHIIV